MKRSTLFLSVFATLLLIESELGAQPGGAERADFGAITFSEIKSANLSSNKINGSDNASNQIPSGTILLFKTKNGRFGKLLIKNYGYNLNLKWTTYNSNGTIYSNGDNLVIKGTFSCDLDLGKEIQTSSDFLWEQVTSIKRYLFPNNAAQFKIYPKKEQEILLIPGLVLGLRHNENQEQYSTNKYMVFFSAPVSAPIQRQDGGDLGAGNHRGYEWWMVKDDPKSNPTSWKLPPGIALGLKHSVNQKNTKSITVVGYDPLSGPPSLLTIIRKFGGDIKASSGEGYWWYETTGAGFTDWSIAKNLPKFTVIGLKHSINQKDKKVYWDGKNYDPVKDNAPSGFEQKFGGDIGANSGEGYYWYEKTSGPEVVVVPDLKLPLNQSLIKGKNYSADKDKDNDGLIDKLEGELANYCRPYLIFDSAEIARNKSNPEEPVTLFQVRPFNLSGSSKQIGIEWMFFYRRDGGYGPNSWCSNKHEGGDFEDVLYYLESRDEGVTWIISCIQLAPLDGSNSLRWPQNSRLEVYDLYHPIIYASASKHHQYFNKDWDHKDSKYTSWSSKCNDDVNGGGDSVLVNLGSAESEQGYYNNVGEPEKHPSPPFVNSLTKIELYKDRGWNQQFFFEGFLKDRWIK